MIEELQGLDYCKIISHFKMRNKPFNPEWFLDYYCGYDPDEIVYKCFFDFKEEIWNFIFKTFVERITGINKYYSTECDELIEFIYDNCDYPMECDGFTEKELVEIQTFFYKYVEEIIEEEIKTWNKSKDDLITAYCLAVSPLFNKGDKND